MSHLFKLRKPTFADLDKADVYNFWAKWSIALVIIVSILSCTLQIAPFLHKDEFIIVDLGRVILHPHTDWSINWLPDRDHPVFVWFYVGPVLQEFCYQVLGQYGPRISGLIGGLVAATVMVKWLLSRGVKSKVAFLLGVVFLLDPLFVQAYTMRVDGWAMALCFASGLILRNAANNFHRQKCQDRLNWSVVSAGALLAVAFFTWPSAAYLVPLVLVELADLAWKSWTVEKNRKALITTSLQFIAGGIVATIFLLIPIAPYAFENLGNIVAAVKVNTQAGPEWGVLTGIKRTIAPFLGLISYLKFTLALSVVSVVSVIKARQLSLAIATLAATLMIFATIIYVHRVLYLVPYFIIAVAALYNEKQKEEPKFISFLWKRLTLVLLLAWCIGLSLIARPFLAFQAKAETGRSLIYRAASSAIGKGNNKVLLLSSVEYYYAGRSLGWKMYAPYIAMGEPLTSRHINGILPHVNYVVTPENVPSKEISEQLRLADLYDKRNYSFYRDSVETFNGKTTNIWRLRFLYAIYEQPYGPYRIYARGVNRLDDPRFTNTTAKEFSSLRE